MRSLMAWWGVIVMLGLSACAYQPPINRATHLIEDAAQTLERFAAHPELKTYSRHLPNARAVIVVPAIHDNGIASGFSVGPAVFVSRTTDGSWSGPSIHDLFVSDYLRHLNAHNRALVLIVKTGPVLESILESGGYLGSSRGVPIHVFGTAAKTLSAAEQETAILVYSDRDVADDINRLLDGAQLVPDKVLNEGMYGEGATPGTIFKHIVGEPATNHYPAVTRRLRRALVR